MFHRKLRKGSKRVAELGGGVVLGILAYNTSKNSRNTNSNNSYIKAILIIVRILGILILGNAEIDAIAAHALLIRRVHSMNPCSVHSVRIFLKDSAFGSLQAGALTP